MTDGKPDHSHDPADCRICGRHATGLGVQQYKAEPAWLCAECALIAEPIVGLLKDKRRFDAYENQARKGGVDAVGEYLTQIGKTDLADMDEAEAEMLVGAAWLGCADRIRQLIRSGDAPF